MGLQPSKARPTSAEGINPATYGSIKKQRIAPSKPSGNSHMPTKNGFRPHPGNGWKMAQECPQNGPTMAGFHFWPIFPSFPRRPIYPFLAVFSLGWSPEKFMGSLPSSQDRNRWLAKIEDPGHYHWSESCDMLRIFLQILIVEKSWSKRKQAFGPQGAMMDARTLSLAACAWRLLCDMPSA